jgi:hypothetical protein
MHTKMASFTNGRFRALQKLHAQLFGTEENDLLRHPLKIGMVPLEKGNRSVEKQLFYRKFYNY